MPFLLRYFWPALIAGFLLAGCSGQSIEDFTGTEPAFVPEDYFQGEITAWGVFIDRFGNKRRHFTVDIEGEWDGRVLTLTEDFVYDDGELDQRIWRLEKTGPGRYTGTANDVEGEVPIAVEGQAMNFEYELGLEVGDDVWDVTFNDWLYRIDDDIVFNRAEVRRWGITIGEVILFFQRRPPAE